MSQQDGCHRLPDYCDNIFRWDISFYASGLCIALSGVFAYAIGTLDVESAEDVNNNEEVEEQRKIAHRT